MILTLCKDCSLRARVAAEGEDMVLRGSLSLCRTTGAAAAAAAGSEGSTTDGAAGLEGGNATDREAAGSDGKAVGSLLATADATAGADEDDGSFSVVNDDEVSLLPFKM